MNLATAVILAWCIDRHWDDDIGDELFELLDAVIAHGETMYPDMTDHLVW